MMMGIVLGGKGRAMGLNCVSRAFLRSDEVLSAVRRYQWIFVTI